MLGRKIGRVELTPPQPVLGLPLTMLRDFVLLRPWNRILTVLGRPWYSEALLRITRYYIQRTSGRLLFNRTWVYSGISSSPLFWGYKDWVTKVRSCFSLAK